MKMLEHMTGQQMAMAVMNDPQFKMPSYPRISDRFRFISLDDNRLLVNGGPEKQLFRGKSVHNIVPYVVEKCDGTKHLDEILNSDQYLSENIFQVLSLLYARGLLQDGTSEEEVSSHCLYDFYDTLVDGTRINKNVDEAISKVVNTQLFIDYHTTKSRILADKLVEYLEPYEIDVDVSSNPKQEEGRKTIIIGICTNDEELPYWKKKSRLYYQKGIPFLFLWFKGENLVVGPYVDKYETICFDCFLDQITRLNLSNVEKETSSNQYHIGLSLIIPMITNVLSEICILQLTQNYVEVFDLNTLDLSTILFTLSINCDTCRNQTIQRGGREKLTIVSQYESLIEFPSRKYLNLKAHQSHYKPKNLNLTNEFKNYSNSPKISVKEFDKENIDSSICKLIHLMTYTTGVKEILPHKVKRWCPTGGNLGSVNLYYFNRKINQLNKSIYFYHPMDNELQQVTDDGKVVQQLFDSEDEKIVGFLILTGEIKKLAFKYKQLSFRLANLDAGVAMAQCQVVSEKLNWEVARLDSFDEDSINDLLGLNDIGEIVTMVLEIREGEINESINK